MASAADWETLEGVRLDRGSFADGDSFRVRYDGEEYTFRLFYVDTPETNDRYPERVQGQARYFSISSRKAMELGEEAADFVQDFLSGSFTVYTDWSDGWGATTRYRAIVEKDGKNLAEELVQRGLARASGFVPDTPWPGLSGTVWEYRSELEEMERQAKRRGVGGWSEQAKPAIGEDRDLTNPNGLVDINSADQDALEALPRIGPVLASRIISMRPFFSLEELEYVSGISFGTIEDLRPLVIVIPPPLIPNTANYLRENARFYLDSSIRVQVERLDPLKDAAPEGFSVADAYTIGEGTRGGKMRLFAPTQNMKFAVQRFSQSATPLEIRAWLRDYEGELILVIYP